MRFLFVFLFLPLAAAAQSMPGMENSAGFLSAGTSIEPKNTSEADPMLHRYLGNWTVMFHANSALVSVQQSGPRGGDKVFSTNWMMPMLYRSFGRQSVAFKTMLSLEPATVTKRFYPELFQSGETAYGRPIIDGQHPHNFVMELSGRYELQFDDRTRVFFYAGPVGDPALGPTAFSHRASASENVLAPLGHHQQDSTHIANSVLTGGFVQGRIQLEASGFHGREPDENRWTIEGSKPDSFSSRITVAVNDNLSGQFSAGRINSREALEPAFDTIRTTASIHHHATFGSGHIATSIIWGRNRDFDAELKKISNSYGLESTIQFTKSNWAWTRIENLDRETPRGRIQAYTLGYERDLPLHLTGLNAGIGAQVTVYGLPPQFKTLYGNNPATIAVLLRLRPLGNMAEHMRLMHRH
jgi:hypothetical protein